MSPEVKPDPFIYVRFVCGGAWDSRLIEWFSGWWTSHVELWIPEDRRTFGAQLRGGVIYRSENDPCYRNVKKWQIWRFPVRPEQYAVGQKLIIDADGSRYDKKAIYHFLLGQLKFASHGHYICSGFMAGYLKGISAARILRPIEKYDPQHIWDIVTNLPGSEKYAELP